MKRVITIPIFYALIQCSFTLTAENAQGGKVFIAEGTEIPIKYNMGLSTDSKDRPPASGIFEVADDVMISGVKTFQKGNRVFCEIIKFKKPGMLGAAGEIEVRIDSVQTSLGKNIPVTVKVLKARGKSKRKKALLMLPALGYGLLVKGGHAELGRENDVVKIKTLRLEQISF